MGAGKGHAERTRRNHREACKALGAEGRKRSRIQETLHEFGDIPFYEGRIVNFNPASRS